MSPPRITFELEIAYLEECATPVGRLLCAGTARHAGISPDAMRVLNTYAVIVLLEGQGQFTDSNRTSFPVEAGDCLVLFPDIAHSYGPPPGGWWREWFFHFEGAAFDLWRQSELIDPLAPVIKGVGNTLLPTLREIAERPSASLPSHLARVCDLLSVMGTLRGQEPDKERRTWLEHAKHVLSAEVNEEKSLEVVAREVGMSYSTFRARFAQEVGQSPARFRAQCRVDAAQKLLERPELSVKAIARSLGWSDEFAFAKNFKAFTGHTPRAYRLGLKDEAPICRPQTRSAG